MNNKIWAGIDQQKMKKKLTGKRGRCSMKFRREGGERTERNKRERIRERVVGPPMSVRRRPRQWSAVKSWVGRDLPSLFQSKKSDHKGLKPSLVRLIRTYSGKSKSTRRKTKCQGTILRTRITSIISFNRWMKKVKSVVGKDWRWDLSATQRLRPWQQGFLETETGLLCASGEESDFSEIFARLPRVLRTHQWIENRLEFTLKPAKDKYIGGLCRRCSRDSPRTHQSLLYARWHCSKVLWRCGSVMQAGVFRSSTGERQILGC